MPGVLVIREGQVIRRFIHETAADRPDYLALVSRNPSPDPAHQGVESEVGTWRTTRPTLNVPRLGSSVVLPAPLQPPMMQRVGSTRNRIATMDWNTQTPSIRLASPGDRLWP